MLFHQVIEEYGGETIPRPFSENPKTKHIFLINCITFYTFFCFISGLEQLKLSFRPLTFISFISFSA